MNQEVSIALLFCVIGAFGLASDKTEAVHGKNNELRNELLQRAKVDQKYRNILIKWMQNNESNNVKDAPTLNEQKKAEFDRLTAKVKKLDRENVKWLKSVVEKHGWPTFTLVGKDGANASWLLVQHADSDPKFQKKCLDLMTRLPKNQVSQSNLAYLKDRVLLAEGKMQVYGTQFRFVDGKLKPQPLEDEANVDKRRAEVGLEPLTEYVRKLEKLYNNNQKN